MPREHGSWSLALEPLALGLIATPSVAGGCLAGAALLGFFARRPLRVAVNDAKPHRREAALRVVAALAAGAVTLLVAALMFGGFSSVVWLLPAAVAGGVFLWYDLRAAGREEAAELAGAAAFACLPGAIATLGGWSAPSAAALTLVMLSRAVPTVLCVRALLRAMKTGVSGIAPAVVGSGLAVLFAGLAAAKGVLPWIAVWLLAALAARTVGFLVWPRVAFRARTIGLIEAISGALFVLTVGIAAAK